MIEVGDTVRVARGWKHGENGTHLVQLDTMKTDTVGKVVHVADKSIDMGSYYWPPFVLEIVKKKNGTVPHELTIETETLTGEQNMKNSRFDIEIVKEKTDDKGKTTNGVVVKRYTKWHRDGNAATEYATKKHGLVILEQEDAGFEVEILVHPFCR